MQIAGVVVTVVTVTAYMGWQLWRQRQQNLDTQKRELDASATRGKDDLEKASSEGVQDGDEDAQGGVSLSPDVAVTASSAEVPGPWADSLAATLQPPAQQLQQRL